ncbi:MAG TPA: hypothetical protein VHO25_16385 [Polyangiaceae bacterium]|nr:hypothetical protein [Polyangiaceae bacterium]
MKSSKRSVSRLATRVITWAALTTVSLGVVSACGSGEDEGGATTTTSGGGSGSGAAGSGSGVSGAAGNSEWVNLPDGGQVQVSSGGIQVTDENGTFTCYQITCAGHLLECGDCDDDDGDGVVDWRDRECLGPCDNTEGPALTAGIGGETGGPCLADCYFDFGNGPGNDDCHWDHRCDPLSVAPDYHPEGEDCEFQESRVDGRTCPTNQSETCLDYCRPLTPNGCDCFGCCTFPELNGSFVWIGSVEPNDSNEGSCTFDEVTNETNCEPCTPVEDCFNDCGVCELCLGKNELPPECIPPQYDGGTPDAGYPPGERCAEGIQPCGLEGEELCPRDYYCITGCCEPTIR